MRDPNRMLEVLVNLVPYGDITQRKPVAVISIATEIPHPYNSNSNYIYTLVEYPAGGNQMICGGRVEGHRPNAGALALIQRALADALANVELQERLNKCEDAGE